MKRTILFIASLGCLFATTPVLTTYAAMTSTSYSTTGAASPNGDALPPLVP